jgi:hypothetical protein
MQAAQEDGFDAQEAAARRRTEDFNRSVLEARRLVRHRQIDR